MLQAAGNAVKRATEALVRAAQQVKDGWDQQDGDFMVNDRMVSGIAQVNVVSLSLQLQLPAIIIGMFIVFNL